MGAVFVLYALSFPIVAAEKEAWRPVKGQALRALLADKEYGDGVHFAYQFKHDGTFTGRQMSQSVSGSWRVRKDEFCWSWLQPPGPSICYEVQQDGAHVRMLVNGSEAWYGTLEPLR